MYTKLSIIIPVYNAEKYIKECIESILPEMDNEIELLLIDDGSKDSSYYIIKKYQSKNIRLFHHENHGVSYTRNIGIQNAKGKYILFVDADDKLDSGWKSIISKGCQSNKDVIYYSRGFNNLEYYEKIEIVRGIFGINNAKVNFSSPCSKLYKRKYLLQNNIKFDVELVNGEDGIFNLCVILNTMNYSCSTASFYQYRIYAESSSKKYSESFFDSNLRYLSLAEKLLRENDIDEYETKRCLSYAVTYSLYLYLVLLSDLNVIQKNAMIKKMLTSDLYLYMEAYPCSKDCNIIVQSVYYLLKHKCFWGAQKIVNLRNKVIRNKVINKQQKGIIKWVTI